MSKTACIIISAILLNCIQRGNTQLNNLLPKSPSVQTQTANNLQSCQANPNSDSQASCSVPSDDLPTGRFIAGSVAREESLFPKWINLTLARQGQKFDQDFRAYIGYCHIYGLVTTLAFPDVADVLMFTHKADTPEGAAKRYTATMAQVLIWYNNLLKEDQDDNVVLTSLANVRVRHITAAQNAADQLAANKTLIDQSMYGNVTLDEAMWEAFNKDLEASNIPQSSRIWPTSYTSRQGKPIPINQFAMAMTQYAFVGFPVLYPERISVHTTDENLFAFNHLWAIIGYALGIEDQYNIALQPNLQQVKAYYQRIFDDYYLPAIFGLKQNFFSKLLIESELDAFQGILPILSPNTVLLRLLRDILNIEVPNMTAHLSLADLAIATAYDAQFIPSLTNPVPRTAVNQILNTYLLVNGVRYFGTNYTTQQSIAENVFYP